MVRKDKDAGDYIRRLRTHHGFNSPEDLARAIRERGVRAGYPASRVSVSGDLIRLVEAKGHQPGSRIKFAIALCFDLSPGHIWKDDALAPVAVPA
jgi:hypothetical protein